MAGLLTGGRADSKRGPEQCGYGGRGQVYAGLPKGWSGIDTSEYSQGHQKSPDSGVRAAVSGTSGSGLGWGPAVETLARWAVICVGEEGEEVWAEVLSGR